SRSSWPSLSSDAPTWGHYSLSILGMSLGAFVTKLVVAARGRVRLLGLSRRTSVLTRLSGIERSPLCLHGQGPLVFLPLLLLRLGHRVFEDEGNLLLVRHTIGVTLQVLRSQGFEQHRPPFLGEQGAGPTCHVDGLDTTMNRLCVDLGPLDGDVVAKHSADGLDGIVHEVLPGAHGQDDRLVHGLRS